MSSAQPRSSLLSMPNIFPTRERDFIRTLAEDLHLLVTWDEYDEHDQNIVTWQFPQVRWSNRYLCRKKDTRRTAPLGSNPSSGPNYGSTMTALETRLGGPNISIL